MKKQSASCGGIVGSIASWLWLIAGLVYDLRYHWVEGRWILDSDLASEMILTDILRKEGGVLTKSWFYSTELRVFNMQWFYRLGFLFSPNDWHLAHTIGAGVCLVCFALAFIFAARSLGLKRYSVWIAGVALWPFGFYHLFLAIYGGYYLIYMIFSLLSLGLIARLAQEKRRGRGIFDLFALLLLAAASGLNGPRQAMMFYFPALLAAMLLLVRRVRVENVESLRRIPARCAEECRMLAASLLALGANGAAFLFETKVLSRAYHFVSFFNLKWRDGLTSASSILHRLELALIDLLMLFGFRGENVGVIGVRGVALGLGLAMGFAILLCLLRLLTRLRELSAAQMFLAVTAGCVILVGEGIFAFTFSLYSPNYWLPLLPLLLLLVPVFLTKERFALRETPIALCVAISACVLLCSVTMVGIETDAPMRGRAGLCDAADALVEEGYTEGYATFWNANALTEMSNGVIEVWSLKDGGKFYEWLQKTSHAQTRPEGNFFVLCDTWNGESLESLGFGGQENARILFKNERLLLYGIEAAP